MNTKLECSGFITVYVKRWRTLIRVPKSIAGEVRETLSSTAQEWRNTSLGAPVFFNAPPCAKITAEGEVFIDWQACERFVVEHERRDPVSLAVVRLALAVRDGTWKPMPP